MASATSTIAITISCTTGFDSRERLDVRSMRRSLSSVSIPKAHRAPALHFAQGRQNLLFRSLPRWQQTTYGTQDQREHDSDRHHVRANSEIKARLTKCDEVPQSC